MIAKEALAQAVADLAGAGCPSPRVDAEWLLADVFGISRTELSADGARQLGGEEAARFEELIRRRAGREPLAYILGEWGFRRLTLAVDRRVLIPRPETEVLVERCLAMLADVPQPRVLDIGAGSGAIALAIADEHRGATVTATESSPGALEVAKGNRERLRLTDRVEIVAGELFAGCSGPFDLVVSNPPYVAREEIEHLEPEVSLFEPRAALVAAGVTEEIVTGAPAVLLPGGSLVLEVANGDAARVGGLLDARGYREVTITPDLVGRERIVDGRTAAG